MTEKLYLLSLIMPHLTFIYVSFLNVHGCLIFRPVH